MRKPLTPEQVRVRAIVKEKIKKEVMARFIQIREEARILCQKGKRFGER